MNLINFRAAIFCGIYCLCAYSMSVNAQEILIDFGNPAASGTTGRELSPFANNSALFTTTLNADGISNSNVLRNPIEDVPVPESGAAGLELTLNATVTSGNDSLFDNGAELRVTGLGLALRVQQALRVDPAIDANLFESAGVVHSLFRLDATHDEFLTLSFNQDVTVSAVVLNNLDPGETFQFGSATNITDLSDMTLPDLTLGTFVSAGDAFGALQTFTFETPIVIPADEEILVGQTGVNPDTLSPSTVGVGFERIILTLGGGDSPLIGDVNLDGMVDFLDIPEFIARVTGGEFQAEADINGDGDVDFLDIPEFIDLLTGA